MSKALQALLREPMRFSLFQALRAIDWSADGEGLSRLRIRHRPYLHHAGTDLGAVRDSGSGNIELVSHVLGLLGPNAPMPLRLTEEAVWQQSPTRDGALGAFLSLLGERQVLRLYEAWRVGRSEESVRGGGTRVFQVRSVSALAGARNPAADNAGWLAQFVAYPRGSTGLEAAIRTLTGLQAQVEQLVGEWLSIRQEDCSRLGRHRLGIDLVAGNRVWQRQTRFKVHLQVPRFRDYLAYIPGRGRLNGRVNALVARYIRAGMTWSLALDLPSTEIPPAQLGTQGELGETAWLGKPGKPRSVVQFGSVLRVARESKPGEMK